MRHYLLLFLALLPRLSATEYTFVKIADNAPGSQFRSLSNPVINANGTVAFNGQLRSGGYGVFRGTADGVETLQLHSGGSSSLGPTAINDAGVTVFVVDGAIFTSNGGDEPSLVYRGTPRHPITLENLPSIDNAGTVAWASTSKIFIKPADGDVRPLLEDGELTRSFAHLEPPPSGTRINNNGSVVFSAMLAGVAGVEGCGCGVFIKHPGAPLKLLSPGLMPVQIAVDDRGTVLLPGEVVSNRAAWRILRDGANGTWVGPGMDSDVTTVQQVADLSPSGHAAFLASRGRALAILTGPDFSRDRVIRSGDPLFGSVAAYVAIGSYGSRINAAGQIAFGYILANGITGVAVATPVEGTSDARSPVIESSGLADAAVLDTATSVAPGSILSIYGTYLAAGLDTAGSAPLPQDLNGVSATVNGNAAPLYFASPGQLQIQIPYDTPLGTAQIQVHGPAGSSEPREIEVLAAVPRIYTLNGMGWGGAKAYFQDTESIVGDVGWTPDSRPAQEGDVVTIYANGLGAVDPPITAGSNSCDEACDTEEPVVAIRHVIDRPVILLANVPIPEENVLFAGLVPHEAGMYRVDIRIPRVARPAFASLQIRQGTAESPRGVTLAIW